MSAMRFVLFVCAFVLWTPTPALAVEITVTGTVGFIEDAPFLLSEEGSIFFLQGFAATDGDILRVRGNFEDTGEGDGILQVLESEQLGVADVAEMAPEDPVDDGSDASEAATEASSESPPDAGQPEEQPAEQLVEKPAEPEEARPDPFAEDGDGMAPPPPPDSTEAPAEALEGETPPEPDAPADPGPQNDLERAMEGS